MISDPVLVHFFNAQDARRALNGLKGQCRDLRVQPMPEPLNGRSWCLIGTVRDTSDRMAVTTIIEGKKGKIVPQAGV
jgi:hypothetical protein